MSFNQRVAAWSAATVIAIAGLVYCERVLVQTYVQPHFMSATQDPSDTARIMLLAF